MTAIPRARTLHDSELDIAASPAPVALIVAEADTNSWLQSMRGVLSGTASGVTKLVVGHPFDTVKVRMQFEGGLGRFHGPLDCMRQTIKNEGFFRGLYKGATPPLLGWTAIDSLMWGSFVHYKKLLQSDPNIPLSLPHHYLAGSMAGLTTVPIVCPIEQVKARLQVQYWDKSTIQYRGPIDCVRQLVRNNGLPGLYQGVVATALFRVQMGFYFGSFEQYKQLLARHYPAMNGMVATFLSGAMAANTLWLIAFPTDLIKNKMMAQRDVHPRKYTSVRQCAREVYRAEGWRGFYRGLTPCMLRSMPTNGCAFLAAETVLRLLPERPSGSPATSFVR